MELRRIILIVLALLTLLLLAACQTNVASSNTVKGSGNYATREFAVADFNGVSSGGGFHVTVTGGSAYKVSVTADDNVLDYISVKKEGQVVRIGFDTTKATSFNTTKLDVSITMPELQTVNVDGGARLVLGQPAPKMSTLNLSGSGGAQADLSAVPVQKATVNLSGGASARIQVTDSLDYDLSGGASLRYTGRPTSARGTKSGGASATPY